jgi:hypothetical protein
VVPPTAWRGDNSFLKDPIMDVETGQIAAQQYSLFALFMQAHSSSSW